MMISKFHRLIQSRVLWAGFLIVIVFSFVIWGTQMPSQSRAAAEANAAGKMNGKIVSRDEFRQAYFNSYMSAVLAVGRPFTITGEMDEQLRVSAWRRLISLKEAARLGLAAGDDEVLATIQGHSGFSADGRFNPARYTAFVQNFLAPLGFTEVQFEEHVREEIALQKLNYMVQQTVLVAPYEINRTFRSLSDVFSVQYVALSESNFADEVSISKEDAYSFFLADPQAFKIPDQVKVQFVSIPAAPYLAEVTNLVTEDDALEYYDTHIDEYAVTNLVTMVVTNLVYPTNDLTSVTNEVVEVETNQITTLTFDQVKTNIFEILTWEAAKGRAAEVATDFVVTLAPDREGNAPTFDEAAAKFSLAVTNAGPFALREELDGIDAGLLFNRAAFSLNRNPEEYFSDAVVGASNVYVIGLLEKIEARVPEFDEVQDEVTEAARLKALSETLAKKAQEIRDAAEKAVEGEKTFASALKPYGLEPVDSGEFTASTVSETNLYSEVLLRGVLARNQGEISGLLPTEEGEVLIAYVAKRTPGSTASLDGLRPQIEDSVRRQRSRVLFENWQEGLLKAAAFEDRSKPVEPESGDDFESDEIPEDEAVPEAVPSDEQS